MRAHANASILVAALALPFLTASCDSDDVGGTSNALTCDEGTFHLVGEIDGMSVDITQPTGGGGLSQDDQGGDFVTNGGARDDDPDFTNLRLTWPGGLLSGDVAAASGTVRLGTRFDGTTFCLGRGTSIRILPSSEGEGVQFRLESLSSGAGCSDAHAGALRGCWGG